MAESQLECLEDGLMPAEVPESSPRFYYSERQRAALEELLRHGDGAFKTLLKTEESEDFLSARELKSITNTFRTYNLQDDEQKNATTEDKQRNSESLRSTYWPQVSDTDVPALDMGWTSSGLFRGVLRVTVHTHPPKANSPHIKEVVRKLIQGSFKVVAIVMDLLTDLQILQDLFEASKRGVSIYIVLDVQGAPHFLDMCNRLHVGARDLQNVRTRTVRGIGMNLSFGLIPGSVQSKYMLIDGDKVMFGTYSFSWTCSRMDRNMIVVMSGPVVDFYDNDFRELYAISEELNLFKEFHLTKPQTGTLARAAVPKRPGTATSRFQVNLGDTSRGNIPAHKYHNPKYLLALGQIPEPSAPIQEFLNAMEAPVPGQQNPDEQLEKLMSVSSQSGTQETKDDKKQTKKKRWFWTFKKQQNDAVTKKLNPTHTDDTSKHTHTADENCQKNDKVKKKKRGLFKKEKTS